MYLSSLILSLESMLNTFLSTLHKKQFYLSLTLLYFKTMLK